MGETSKIEWTDATFNPWVGCTKISPGCDHCYAEHWAKRSGMVTWGETRRRTTPANWRKPLAWHAAIPDGQRLRVFCASLADVFDNDVPAEWRADLFELIRQTPRIDWLLLTKRIGNVKAMFPPDWGNSILGYHNVWLGITVVNQEEFDRDVPKLRALPACIRFLSCEPLLGPISGWDYHGIDWVIVGGESGSKARPMEEDWAFTVVRMARLSRAKVFMKQGSQANWPDFKNIESFHPALRVREWPPHAFALQRESKP
jgi:protein gp37